MGYSSSGMISVRNNRNMLKRKHRGRSHAYKYSEDSKAIQWKKLTLEERKIIEANQIRQAKKDRDKRFTLILVFIALLTSIAIWILS